MGSREESNKKRNPKERLSDVELAGADGRERVGDLRNAPKASGRNRKFETIALIGIIYFK